MLPDLTLRGHVYAPPYVSILLGVGASGLLAAGTCSA